MVIIDSVPGKTVDDIFDDGYDVTIKPQDIITKRPWVDVRAFGAIPNDGIDDTRELQAALDAARGSRKKIVYIPYGEYLVSSPIVLNRYGGYDDAKIYSDFAIIKATRPMTQVIKIGTYTRNSAEIQIHGLQIDANNLADYGFYGERISRQDSLIQNCWVYNARRHGWYLYGCQAARFENVISSNNGGDGFYIDGCNGTTFDTIRGVLNQNNGITITTTEVGTFSGGCQLLNVNSEVNKGHGIEVTNTRSPVLIHGGWLERNELDGVRIGNAVGVVVQGLGILGTMTDCAVRLVSGAKGCMVTHNAFQCGTGSLASWTQVNRVRADSSVSDCILYPNVARGTGTLLNPVTSNDFPNPVLIRSNGLFVKDKIGLNCINPEERVTLADGNFYARSGYYLSPYGGIGRYENLLVHSEEFDHGSWTKGSMTTVTPDTTIAPNGLKVADTIVATGTSGPENRILQIYDTGTSTRGRTFTASVWLKADTDTHLFLWLSSTLDSYPTYTEIYVPTTWKRFAFTGTFPHTVPGTHTQVRFTILSPDGFRIYAWGAQLEEQADHGVYIRTIENRVTSTGRGLVTNDYMHLLDSNGNVGVFTFAADSSTIVSNTSVTANSIIVLFPANAAAANMVSSSKSPYILTKTPGVSFTVSTADGTAATGTEIFNYIIFN
jgi:hypothetical protein